MAEELIAGFDRAMHRILERAAALKPPLAFPGFRGMLAEHGGKRTADILLAQPQVSDGFTKLVLHSLETDSKDVLQLTVEHLVLEQPWRQLFTSTQRRTAERRLRDVGYEPPADQDKVFEPLVAPVEEKASAAAEPRRPRKRISDLRPPTRRHSRYALIIDSEGWVPLILCDKAGCYWNAVAAQTRDGRTITVVSTAAQEHLLRLLQANEFGDEARNAFVDHRRWDYIYDNLLNWPNVDVIAREHLRVLDLRRASSKTTKNSDTPVHGAEAALPLGPTTGPRPTSWTGLVSRDATGRSHVYVFQFGDREVWKIGHTMDVEARLAEVNKHVPYEILGEQWRVCRHHHCASHDAAYAMEQSLLVLLRTSSSMGERVICTRESLDKAWEAVVTQLAPMPRLHEQHGS